MRRLIVTAQACEIPSVGSNVRIVAEVSPLNFGHSKFSAQHGVDMVEGVEVWVNGNGVKSDLAIRGDLESMEKLGARIRKACEEWRAIEARRKAEGGVA